MKALTICQPYAELILRGQKRVENRTWNTRHRGLIYLHAGKSRAWLSGKEDTRDMAFGAIVGIVRVADCVTKADVIKGTHDDRFPWLRQHEHAEGPWCWVIDEVTPIGPWPWRGAQGLFDVNEKELDAVANRVLGVAQS